MGEVKTLDPMVDPISSDAQIEKLLRDAAEFATRSIEGIVSQLEEDHGTPNKLFYDYVKILHGLEVHFLFPNLDERARELITALSSARGAMLMGLKKLQAGTPVEEEAPRRAMVTHLRNRFADLKGQIQASRIADKLTTLQRRILENHFLTDP